MNAVVHAPLGPTGRQVRAYILLAPFFLLFALFFLSPLVQSLILSLHSSIGPRQQRFVGLANYRFLIRDPLFWLALLNTAAYVACFLALLIPLSLALALLLHAKRVRFRNAFRAAFFSAHFVGQTFAAALFATLMMPRQGLVNRVAAMIVPGLGVETDWRNNPRFALPALVIASLWLTIGQTMIYFLAALHDIDPDLYQMARIDGAGTLARFRNVTLPSLQPVIAFVVLIGTIGGFQLFELPYLFFNGPGPAFSGLTVVMYLYQQGFDTGNLGYAAAIGWGLTLLIGSLALIQSLILRKVRQ